MKKALITTVVLACCITSVATADDKDKVQFSNPNKTIVISGDSHGFTLTLKSNATTGYRWLLADYNPNMFQVAGATYVAPNNKLVGAPGYEKWVFKLNANNYGIPIVSKIKMQYAQPWAAANSTSYTTFTVVSLPGSD